MDLWTLAHLLEDIAPIMEVIEGKVFLDRNKVGRDALLVEIKKYKNLSEAQYWINSVPIDDLFSDISEDWSVDNPAIENIKNIYSRSWTVIAQESGVDPKDISIYIEIDRECGDVIFRLGQV